MLNRWRQAVVAEPPQLVSGDCSDDGLVSGDYSDEGCFVYGDTFAFTVHERMQGRRGATAGPAVTCTLHVHGLASACHMDLTGQAKVNNVSDKPQV